MTDYGINEYFVFGVFFLLGLTLGLALYFIIKIKSRVFSGLLQFIFAGASVYMFFIFSLKFCYGLISINMFLGGFLGSLLGYFIIGNLFGKLLSMCYNSLRKISQKLDKILVIRRKHGKPKTKNNS